MVDSVAVALLSRVTGEDLTQQDLDLTVLFLASLAIVLWGVTVIDQTVTIREEQQLEETLNQLIPPDHRLHDLMEAIEQGVEQQQTYLDAQALVIFANPLSESARLLLLALGYEIAQSDGAVNILEQMYLQAIAQRLNLPPRYQTTLDAHFMPQGSIEAGSIEASVLEEIQTLLDSSQFQAFDANFTPLTTKILATLSPPSSTMEQ